MILRRNISQYTPIDTQNCITLQLVFQNSLHNLTNQLIPITKNLQDKIMTKCILIPAKTAIPQPKYQYVVLGGTFDYFHIGHQMLLLTAIFSTSKRILIGITGQSMLQKKKNKQIIQPFHIRMKEIQNYIKLIKPQLQIQIKQLSDAYGPAISRAQLQAIVVSIQTIIGGKKINQARKQKGLKQLYIQLCPLMGQDLKIQSKLSSSQIRQYILDKNRMNLQTFIDYKSKWQQLSQHLSKYLQVQNINDHSQQWFNKIIYKYSQYWRFYHINLHIFQMLSQFQNIPEKQKLSELEQLTVLISIWFHDIQYIPSAKNNQQMSAKIAEEFIKGFSSTHNQKFIQLIQAIFEAILATKHHKSQKYCIQLLIDLDMSILNSPLTKYQQYAKAVKLQYLPVVKKEYNKRRAQFLKHLNVKQIFYIKKAQNIQNNINWQLKNLQQNIQ